MCDIVGQTRRCPEEGNHPCSGGFVEKRESSGCTQNRHREPGHWAAFSCPQRVDPGSGEHGRSERDHAHQLLRVAERRPERHHVVEDLVEAAVSSKRQQQGKATEQCQYS